MNVPFLTRLNKITAACEALQNQYQRHALKSDAHRRLYEGVAKAKRALIDALSAADEIQSRGK